MRYTKALLSKPADELTDDELRAIGAHFAKHPPKPVVKLHKCITCKKLLWYDNLGEALFECLDNLVIDLAKDADKLINVRKACHWRRCEGWHDDNLPWPEEYKKPLSEP